MFDFLYFGEAYGVQKFLRNWRENTDRRSILLIQVWEQVLAKRSRKIYDKHVIHEQVAVASLDFVRTDITEQCIQKLSSDFANSSRVFRLKAMYEESLGNYDQAAQLLDLFMKKEETNPTIRKRKIALIKTSQSNFDAILEACRYLPRFLSDQDAWHELGNFYLEEGDYIKAAFCTEELLLHNPQSYLVHLRLGDIYYTMGGIENIGFARSYYFYAIKLNSKSMRALYGLYMCCIYILNAKCSIGKRSEAQALGDWVLDQVAANFASSAPSDCKGYKGKFYLSAYL